MTTLSDRQLVLLTALNMAGPASTVTLAVWLREAAMLSLSWYGRDLDTPPGRRIDLTITSLVRRGLVEATAEGYTITAAGREEIRVTF